MTLASTSALSAYDNFEKAEAKAAAVLAGLPFLRVPPFPGAKVASLRPQLSGPEVLADTATLVARLRDLRVGGAYWGAQPPLPDSYVLVRSAAGAAAAVGAPIVLWDDPVQTDPWHMLSEARAFYPEEGDAELRLIAAILQVPTFVRDAGGEFRPELEGVDVLLKALLPGSYVDPFTGLELNAAEAIELCGFWRSLIDSNRDIAGALGFAFWKRDNVAPLLWGGSEPVRFVDFISAPAGRPFAVWRSKAPQEVLDVLERSGVSLIEVEDGFLRSQGLGADCVPPLSITVDRFSAYFDPAKPSELERILQDGDFDPEVLERAHRLRSAIIEAGLGKYEVGGEQLERPAGDRRHILVPGQVEDDRSVLSGGAGLTSNLDLLKRARTYAPDAYILYKPHPDVVAGHRKGTIPDRTCLEFADALVIDQPISSLIAMVDELHVNTSLAGFEALLREKAVTAHGVPFYAGWGLTRDLGPVPARRTAKRTVDELVAASLLLYPRYLDPVTGLPCPAEVVVDRLTRGGTDQTNIVVTMRRLQGRVMRALREMVQ